MLDPRIYRTGLVAVVLAVIVFAFSLQQQSGSLSATLAPQAFNGQNAYTDMTNLASLYPRPLAGSASDDAIAAAVTSDFKQDDFSVSSQSFRAGTPSGTRTLENVIGVRSGLENGTIVVVADRDAVGAEAATQESGTGVLLDLASVLSGETLNHTVALVSSSGSTGAVGASQLIHALPGPLEAVLVLGDMAGTTVRYPLIVPWSSGVQLAPPLLRNTVASALSSQANLPAGGTSFGGQFVHMAFPFTVGDQGPFNAHGIPAVLLSTSGELLPAGHEVPSLTQITQLGSTALQTISALDSGHAIPSPSAYLQIDGNIVPEWAIRLLVLALILPVLIATIDGFARARRRGYGVLRWALWILACAAPFALSAAIVLIAKLTGLLAVAPPGPVASGAIPLGATGTVLLIVIACVVVCPLFLLARFKLLRPQAELPARMVPGQAPGGNPGAASALLLLMCAVSLAVWFQNPFAAALMVPALHLWMWGVSPEMRMHPGVRLAMLVVGLAPPILVVLYYMITLAFNPISLAWSGVLMIAGGHIGVVAAIEWCIALGCAFSVFGIAAWSVRRVPITETAVTVRGPVTYAGPGSLGGTKSALRR